MPPRPSRLDDVTYKAAQAKGHASTDEAFIMKGRRKEKQEKNLNDTVQSHSEKSAKTTLLASNWKTEEQIILFPTAEANWFLGNTFDRIATSFQKRLCGWNNSND